MNSLFPHSHAPGYGPNGQNIFGMNSPIQSMAGDDPNKQQQLTQYYQGLLGNPGDLDPAHVDQIKAMFNPTGADPTNTMNMFRQKMLNNSNLEGQQKGQQQVGQMDTMMQSPGFTPPSPRNRRNMFA